MAGWSADATLINGSDVTKYSRGYMALGTFDDDNDTDKGCVMLNVMDLSLIGLDENSISGTEITFTGYAGPNDGSGLFLEILEKVYTVD